MLTTPFVNRTTTAHVRTMTRRSINAQWTRVAVLVAVLFASVAAITPRSAAASSHEVGLVGTVVSETGTPFTVSTLNGTFSVQVYDHSRNVWLYPPTYESSFLMTVPANGWYYIRASGLQGTCLQEYNLSWVGEQWVYAGDTSLHVTVPMYPTPLACY